MLSRSLPVKLSASYFHGFQSVQRAVSLPPSEALPKLFPRFPLRPACCLAPSQLSASYLHGFLSVQHAVIALSHAVSLPPGEALRQLFPRFPVRPARCLAPSQRSSPQAISAFSSPSSMLSRSLQALRKLFARFPLRPTCCVAPSHAVSLPPGEALPKLFPRFPLRPACCLAPSQLSASYLHGFRSVQHAVSLPPGEAPPKLFARFPLRPACCLAPSQRSSISTVSSPSSMLYGFSQRSFRQAISTVTLSVQHAVSLPPGEAFHNLFPRFPVRSLPAYPSSMLSRSLPAKLSPSYFHGFLSVQHAVSLLPAKLSKAICTVSSLSSMLSRSLPAKLSASYFHGFLSVQHAVSLPPSSPQAICTFSFPSSMLSRSLSAKLSGSYLHGFLSVQHAVSLLPSEVFRKLFARFPLRPACCLAPSQRSSPKAISTVSYLSSMLSRSLPA